jgi:hypothetical protein
MHWSPTRVDALMVAGHKIGDLSCGSTHPTTVAGVVEEVPQLSECYV